MPGSSMRERRSREPRPAGALLERGRQHGATGDRAEHETRPAITAKWGRSGTPSAAIRPVAPAPAMAPRLNMPCSDDMIGRQWRFSTATPWAFIETSSAPEAAPTRSSARPRPIRSGASASPGRLRPYARHGYRGRRPAAVAVRGGAGERHRDQRADRGHEQGEPELTLADPELVLDLRDPRHPAALAEAVQAEDRGHPGRARPDGASCLTGTRPRSGVPLHAMISTPAQDYCPAF